MNIKTPKVREVNIGSNNVGKLREHLYRKAYEQIGHAKRNECWLEVVAICDSLIADRLEALLAAIKEQNVIFRAFCPVGEICNKYKAIFEANGLSSELLDEIMKWANGRNRHMHEMVKVREGESITWESRTQSAKEDADKGVTMRWTPEFGPVGKL